MSSRNDALTQISSPQTRFKSNFEDKTAEYADYWVKNINQENFIFSDDHHLVYQIYQTPDQSRANIATGIVTPPSSEYIH